MTTAHKPTFHPAVGTANQGGYRYLTDKVQMSARDLPGQLQMKYRQIGQNAPSEIEKRDLESELNKKEKEYEKKKMIGIEYPCTNYIN